MEEPGGHPIWYLSDSGYSRVVWNDDRGDVFLTSNSTSKVKANWDKAGPGVRRWSAAITTACQRRRV